MRRQLRLMAPMTQTWSTAVVVLLAVQLCIVLGDKACAIWSSAGPVVQRGSTFRVFCTFNCRNKRSMLSFHPPTPQKHNVYNSTTLYVDVTNITERRTFSCKCAGGGKDPCGQDIAAGYPPDRPKNISCTYTVRNNESGLVSCTWNKGRETYLQTKSSTVLWVRGAGTDELLSVSSNRAAVPSAALTVPSRAGIISVWVHTQNPLGASQSTTFNYTLGDIATPPPPGLGRPECSSRGCLIGVSQPVMTQHLEIQHRTEQQTWTTDTHSGEQMNSTQSIGPLQPHSFYHFRARSRFSSGLWSEWSTDVWSWTEEEAPAKELDVWYAQPAADDKSLKVFWKEMNETISRGTITEYIVTVNHSDSGLISVNVSADERSYSVQCCSQCEVTVSARNSRGRSPPARVTARHTEDNPPLDVRVTTNKHNVTLSWSEPETALLPAAYVVEWYPEGLRLQELRWVRLDGAYNGVVITDMKAYECYEGAVCVLHSDGAVSRTRFRRVSTAESVPASGPSVQQSVEGSEVRVSWTQLPRGQRGGCITQYTIYLEKSSGSLQRYSVAASERAYTIRNLPPAVHSLWMTAWTSDGEGPAGQKVKFFIQHDPPVAVPLLCAAVVLLVLVVLCLCQSSAFKQRTWIVFSCFKLDVVPDPANSKWAKECVKEKGTTTLQLQLNMPSVAEDDEPILVDVEELPEQSTGTFTPSYQQQLPPRTNRRPETDTRLYPRTTYTKSFSHDSDGSDRTQTTADTNVVVDYISTHVEDRLEEEEEEDDMMTFFPSHNTFTEPIEFGGKLTLDAVRIDCSSIFQDFSS